MINFLFHFNVKVKIKYLYFMLIAMKHSSAKKSYLRHLVKGKIKAEGILIR